MNPLSPELITGTVGELLVQLRLLQFDVQAAPPLKDSGNDLIAIKRKTIKAIQVKTTTGDRFSNLGDTLHRLFDALALVVLVGEDRTLHLDDCRIFLLSREEIRKSSYTISELRDYELSPEVVNRIFG